MAIPYVKGTWADGSTTVSAARMNNLEQGVTDAHQMPSARVFNSATISVANNTETFLTFNSERWDTDTIHDTSSNTSRLTCKSAGKYFISGNVEWASSPGIPLIRIKYNGSTIIAAHQVALSTGDYRIQQIQTVWDMAVNDYVELTVIQNSGGALSINSSSKYSPEFMMVRVA